ncbi:MAG: hypothetical protein ABR578_11365 [Chromatocurvus sp.]
MQTVQSSSIDILTLSVAVIGVAILVGYVILEALVWLEACTWGALWDVEFMTYVPLFPLAMIGGLLVQGLLVALFLMLFWALLGIFYFGRL